jgi:hypothetical protein
MVSAGGAEVMKKTKIFKLCSGCKFNISYGKCESVCEQQEMMLKGVREVPGHCEVKQERVRTA